MGPHGALGELWAGPPSRPALLSPCRQCQGHRASHILGPAVTQAGINTSVFPSLFLLFDVLKFVQLLWRRSRLFWEMGTLRGGSGSRKVLCNFFLSYVRVPFCIYGLPPRKHAGKQSCVLCPRTDCAFFPKCAFSHLVNSSL